MTASKQKAVPLKEGAVPCRHGEAGNAKAVLDLLDSMEAAAEGKLTPVARVLATEGVMAGWYRQGRDAALLARAEALSTESNPLPDAIEACCNASWCGTASGASSVSHLRKYDMHLLLDT